MIAFRKNKLRMRYAIPSLALVILLILGIAWDYCGTKNINYLNREERIEFLVNELTTTPERQQKALDEIVMDGSGAFVYLLEHLDDSRPLANGYALFLNTDPKTFEKYFHAGGSRVGETMLRYLCWKTGSCEFTFDANNAMSIKTQRAKAEKYVRSHFREKIH